MWLYQYVSHFLVEKLSETCANKPFTPIYLFIYVVSQHGGLLTR